MELREYIKQYRKENHLTMQELADRCGLSKGYISMLESGKHPNNGRPIVPSIETYGKLAAGMGMQIDALLRAIDGDSAVSVGADSSDLKFRAEIDSFPEVRMIARAGKKMDKADREKMLALLKVAFPDKFED